MMQLIARYTMDKNLYRAWKTSLMQWMMKTMYCSHGQSAAFLPQQPWGQYLAALLWPSAYRVWPSWLRSLLFLKATHAVCCHMSGKNQWLEYRPPLLLGREVILLDCKINLNFSFEDGKVLWVGGFRARLAQPNYSINTDFAYQNPVLD